jgi:anti-sigma regulatory factor (Ser/Thr protein kinase)
MNALRFQEDAETIVRPGVRAELGTFAEFASAACLRAGAAPADGFAVRLAVEEVCANIINHGYGGRANAGPIALSIASSDGRLTITIADRAPLFRPQDAPAPDLESGWDTREAGGLGWHLVRSSVDEVRHAPVDGGGNVVTLVKRISNANQPGETR